MTSPRTFRPDLTDAVLEDRTLMAYSPFVPQLILTSGGYTGLITPPGLSGNLSTIGGGAIGGGGGNMGTSFYVTGFGTSTIAIGNATGYAGVGVAGSSGGTAGSTVTLSTQVGSGAAENSGAGGGVSRYTVAQGGTDAVLNTLYIGQTAGTGGSPNGGYSGPGARSSAPPPVQAPVPPAPPPV